MLNFQPELTDPRWLATNQYAIERHINDDHYVRGFTPGEFVLVTATHATAILWPRIVMTAAATSYGAVSWRKPSEWRAGHLAVSYWFTSDVGGTNNFRIVLDCRAIRETELLDGTSLLSSASLQAGPASAFAVKKSVAVYTSTALGSDDQLFSLRIQRDGTHADDNNANPFWLLYVEVEHIPSVQVSD